MKLGIVPKNEKKNATVLHNYEQRVTAIKNSFHYFHLNSLVSPSDS